jgi:DNA-binding transcriptional MerR regulator
MPYTTSQVAKIAHVSPSSVRNYTNEYAELLSPAARGENGSRLFDDADLQVFCTIADLRKAGIPPAEIIERIRSDAAAAAIIDLTPQSATSHSASPAPQPLTNAPQAPQTAAMPLTRHDMQLLIKTYAITERQRHQESLWSHAIAFYLGVLTMGTIFFLVWWIINL